MKKKAKVIDFPGKKRRDQVSCDQQDAASPPLKPSLYADRELDRTIRSLREDDPLRMGLQRRARSSASSHVLRLLRKKPQELLVFCNTVTGEDDAGVLWGDVYCLGDGDRFCYIFTLFTVSYVQDCRRLRGETIDPSSENILLPVPELTLDHVRRGTEKWVKEYYPGLDGIPIRLESPELVREMLRDSLGEDDLS